MDLLKVGQTLSIFYEKGDNLVEMVCTIAAIYDDRLEIELPQYFMRYVQFLEVGAPLTIKVFSKAGTIDFNTVVIASPLEDNFCVELDYNAMRLTPNEEIPVIGAMENLQITFNDNVYSARTFEISPEFIKFYSDKSFKLDDNLDCVLSLPKNYGTITFKAVIKDIDPDYANEYTISLYNMTEDSRQSLLYYIYVYSNDSDWDK